VSSVYPYFHVAAVCSTGGVNLSHTDSMLIIVHA
jgi:hypothetical protein